MRTLPASARGSANRRRIPRSRAAESVKETASPMKAASRPSVAATMPPSMPPTANMAPHAAPASTLAAGRSSGSTRLGTAAEEAGSKRAPSPPMAPASRNATQTSPGSSISRYPRASAARARSEPTMSSLRSKRSARCPPTGERMAKGTVWVARARVTRAAEPVSSLTSPTRATVVNQSPENEMSCAP